MKVREAYIYVVMAVLCCNVFISMLESAGISTNMPSQYNIEDSELNLYDYNETLDSYHWTSEYSDFVTGVIALKDFVSTLLNGFPRILIAAGMPWGLVRGLEIVVNATGLLSMAVYYIGGREI